MASLAIGVACIAIILLCRHFAPKFPGAILALVLSGLAVVVWDLEKLGVAIVGAIPTGLPGLSLPVIGFADFEELLPVALVAALLSFSDTMIVARAFGLRSGQKIDADQELVALGVANLVSGVSKGLPVSASDSRTAVAEAAGARTQATSVIAAIVIAATMLWLTGLLRYLPTAALAGVMVAAAVNVCDFREFARLWRFRGVDLVGALVTLVGVAVLGLMEGILAGVVFSLVQLLRAFAFPPDAVLGRLPDGTWHDPKFRREAEKTPRMLVYRFSGPLFFANASLFRERLDAQLAEHPDTKAIVLDCGAIHHVDLMACEMLAELDTELGEDGVRLAFADLRDRVKRDIVRGLELGPHMPDPTFPSVEEAAQAMSNAIK
jgi:MFS superfamily sulfate permease-like transporter